jgi:hypothetical protein
MLMLSLIVSRICFHGRGTCEYGCLQIHEFDHLFTSCGPVDSSTPCRLLYSTAQKTSEMPLRSFFVMPALLTTRARLTLQVPTLFRWHDPSRTGVSNMLKHLRIAALRFPLQKKVSIADQDPN